MSTTYIRSSTPGKTWGISYYKAPGRNAAFTATEGTLVKTDTGFTSFSFMMFEAKQVRQPILGTATKRKQQEAFRALLAKMRDEGLIEEDA